MSRRSPDLSRIVRSPNVAGGEILIVAAMLLAVLASQWILSVLVPGTNYYGVDGRMAQSAALAAFKFAEHFDVSNLSPLQGVGSQMPPKNVWINPAFWPFALFDTETATDVSALIAFACFAGAVYIMMRCCDVPRLPSALAMVGCLVLFAPAVLALRMPANFLMTPADAVVYAPYMVALGLLARLRPGSWRSFALTAGGISALVLYSIGCDPLWTMVAAISWAVPFAVITLSGPDRKTIALRALALGCCLAVIVLSGAAEYLYALSQYTARVQFAAVLDRARGPELISALSFSPGMKYVYLFAVIGWLAGLATLRGRALGLVIAAIAAFASWLACAVVYVLLNAAWVIPFHAIWACPGPALPGGALAGYGGALTAGASWLGRIAAVLAQRGTIGSVSIFRGTTSKGWRLRSRVAAVALAVLCALLAAKAGRYGLDRIQTFARAVHDPWVNEPEFAEFLSRNIGLAAGQPFRGTVNVPTIDLSTLDSLASLWARGVPSLNEYSQLVTPEALYFVHGLLKRDVRPYLNHFNMFWSEGVYTPAFWRALEVLGVRYSAAPWPLPDAVNPGLPMTTQPHRPHGPGRPPGNWYIYELPHPNVGNYSPTNVVIAGSGPEIMASLSKPGFDFATQVVLSAPLAEPLLPARDMQLAVIRGRLHVSGHSAGTSFVLPPQQFSHCLRARDERVRFVRANLMMAGMIFAGNVDTDILFDYGIFLRNAGVPIWRT